jgi:hypothetical protein
MTGSKTRNRISMKHIVIPETVEGCDCEDCRAGRHLYSLFCWRDGEWSWRATSLRAYTGVEECKQKHPWMLVFEPGSTWEDGTPLVDPEPVRPAHCEGAVGGMVPLDTEKLKKSADLLAKHWNGGRGRE